MKPSSSIDGRQVAHFTSNWLPALVAGLLAVAITAEAAAEQFWPQWRGPLATGVAPDANPPVEWSEEQNVRWKVRIPGRGMSTPIIWGDRLFIQTAIPTGKKAAPAQPEAEAVIEEPIVEPANRTGRRRGRGMRTDSPTELHRFVLLCLDRNSGKQLWQQVAREELPHEGHHGDHSFSSHSPVTDGQHVFAYFGSRGLHCYHFDGTLKWEKDLGRMQTKNAFGEGSSPALHGNVIVVNWDHEGDDFIVALDKSTGKELWRQPREEDTSWSTPLIVEHQGKAQVITAATNKVRSYDLQSGELIWHCDGLTANAIPTPVASEGVVFVTSGFRGNELLAIELGHTGDLTGTDAILWQHDRTTPYVPSPLLYGERLFLFSGNKAILACFDTKTGKQLIEPARIEGVEGVYASPVGASDRLYLVGRNGGTSVIKNASQLEVLATNQLDERFDASPAIVGNQLFLRGHEYLYCIAEE